MIMRQAKIYYNNLICGLLTETNDGDFTFKYENEYVNTYTGSFMTFTMPVRVQEYKEKRLFAFFEGLIPEGWLLDIASKSWKINKNDRMGLLLACCQNCIGAVSVEPVTENYE
jgi:serine/threonine-protein kinase HipA